MSDADNCGRVDNATPLHPQRGLAVPRRTFFEASVRRWFSIQGVPILMVAISFTNAAGRSPLRSHISMTKRIGSRDQQPFLQKA